MLSNEAAWFGAVGAQGVEGWDISNLSYSGKSLNVSAQTQTVNGLFMSDDDQHLYVADNSGNIFQYDGSSPELDTYSYTSKSVSLTGGFPYGGFMLPGGNDIGITLTSTGTDLLRRYSLSTAYDISTATDASDEIVLNASTSEHLGSTADPDAEHFYVYQYTTPLQLEYWKASTAGDFSSATLQNTLSLPGTLVVSPAIKPDGTKLFLYSRINQEISQYTMSTPWSLSSATNDNVDFDVSSQVGNNGRAFCTNSDGTRFYVADSVTEIIYQYDVG